jgi:hypothetical protein
MWVIDFVCFYWHAEDLLVGGSNLVIEFMLLDFGLFLSLALLLGYEGVLR